MERCDSVTNCGIAHSHTDDPMETAFLAGFESGWSNPTVVSIETRRRWYQQWRERRGPETLIVITDRERDHLAGAVEFYLDRVTFATGDEAQEEYQELLDRLERLNITEESE